MNLRLLELLNKSIIKMDLIDIVIKQILENKWNWLEMRNVLM